MGWDLANSYDIANAMGENMILMRENKRLKEQNQLLQAELAMAAARLQMVITAKDQEIAALKQQRDIDAVLIAGRNAQAKALVEEAKVCPEPEAHPLVKPVDPPDFYSDGQPRLEIGTVYHQAASAEAAARGLEYEKT